MKSKIKTVRHLLLIGTVILLIGCIGTKKFSSFVEPKFPQNETTLTNDNFIFDLSELKPTLQTVTATKIKSRFIPAILYWQLNNTIKCEIKPVIIGQSFQENFLYYADSLSIYKKLQKQKVEIKLEKIPTSFVWTHEWDLIFLLVAYGYMDLEAIFPQDQDLVVSYKLTQNGLTSKDGKLTVSNKDVSIGNIWKSTKKFTWLYINQFKQNNKKMAKEIVEKLMTEI